MTTHTVPQTSENPVSLQPWMHREDHGLAADVLSRQQNGVSQPPKGFPPLIHGPDKIQPHRLDLDGPDVAAVEETLNSSHGKLLLNFAPRLYVI